MHKFPSAEVVRFVLRELRPRRIASQQEFAALVATRLRKTDPAYRISGRRLRRIAATSGVRITVRTQHGRAPKHCPSCGRMLLKTFTTNLAGKKVLAGLRCRSCVYRGSNQRFAPHRYAFEL